MKLLWWIFLLACAVPALLFAVAIGPVAVGVLCAVGCAAVVAAVAYLLGVTAVSIERAGAHFVRRTRGS